MRALPVRPVRPPAQGAVHGRRAAGRVARRRHRHPRRPSRPTSATSSAGTACVDAGTLAAAGDGAPRQTARHGGRDRGERVHESTTSTMGGNATRGRAAVGDHALQGVAVGHLFAARRRPCNTSRLETARGHQRHRPPRAAHQPHARAPHRAQVLVAHAEQRHHAQQEGPDEQAGQDEGRDQHGEHEGQDDVGDDDSTPRGSCASPGGDPTTLRRERRAIGADRGERSAATTRSTSARQDVRGRASPTLTVTPSTNLLDGQTVASATNYPANTMVRTCCECLDPADHRPRSTAARAPGSTRCPTRPGTSPYSLTVRRVVCGPTAPPPTAPTAGALRPASRRAGAATAPPRRSQFDEQRPLPAAPEHHRHPGHRSARR